ncbi:hypothetical protein AB0D94_19775 [Streptomyces sp. NPDC048255]|uniref:hypothetical protein n=1 Tax=Streptomyces sp. NPDC048255 TaxID=3154713 RepID=UPI0033E3CD25
MIQVQQPPAVADARDRLLEAIDQEAQRVVETQPGQASAALGDLARAFALVTAGTAGTAGPVSPAIRRVNLEGVDGSQPFYLTPNH